jgi:hypothetical protein
MAEAKMVARWMAALLAACAAPAAAQTITPGMSSAQVQSVLGAPVTTRQSGDWSYLYYLNGCAVRCGSDDVVFLQNDRVVTAVFRTGRRRFAGPRADAALERTSDAVAAADARGSARADQAPTQMRVHQGAREEPGRTVIGRPPARVGGVRVDGGEARSGGGTTIIRRDETELIEDRRGGGRPLGRTGSLEARGRVNDTRADDRNQITGTGVDSPGDDAAAIDSARGAPATAVDDARRARESRIEPNTVRTRTPGNSADSTLNRARRERERNVMPRAVTRP